MELHFNQTEAHLYDLAKQQWKIIFGTKTFKIVGIFILILTFLNILLMILNGSASISLKSFITWFIPFAMMVAIWIFLIPMLTKRQLRNPTTAKIALGERHIYLNEENVIVKTPNSESSFEWDIMTKLKSSKLSYFLYIGKYQAIIIPKSVFADQTTQNDFEQLIARKINLKP